MSVTDETTGNVRRRGMAISLQRDGINLTPVTPNDYPFLYHISTSSVNSVMWRYHGNIPPMESFVAQLFQDVLTQFVVRLDDGRPIGHIVAYAGNLRNRHVHLGTVLDESTKGERRGSSVISLFIEYLFAVWDFRGIFVETPDFVAGQYRGSRRLGGALPFEVVGRRPDFHYFDGQYYDDLIYYLSRDRWETHRQPVLPSPGEALGSGPASIPSLPVS